MVRNVSSSSWLAADFGSLAKVGSEFLQHLRVHAGMLADIERVQVKSEFANLAQQRTDVSMGQAFSAVRLQAFLHQD